VACGVGPRPLAGAQRAACGVMRGGKASSKGAARILRYLRRAPRGRGAVPRVRRRASSWGAARSMRHVVWGQGQWQGRSPQPAACGVGARPVPGTQHIACGIWCAGKANARGMGSTPVPGTQPATCGMWCEGQGQHQGRSRSRKILHQDSLCCSATAKHAALWRACRAPTLAPEPDQASRSWGAPCTTCTACTTDQAKVPWMPLPLGYLSKTGGTSGTGGTGTAPPAPAATEEMQSLVTAPAAPGLHLPPHLSAPA
jgi:hypothetical protein